MVTFHAPEPNDSRKLIKAGVMDLVVRLLSHNESDPRRGGDKHGEKRREMVGTRATRKREGEGGEKC